MQKFVKEYTALFECYATHNFCPFCSFFRRQHFSYPYWTDFAYRSSPCVSHCVHALWSPGSSPGSVSHLLILLSVVLVFWRRARDSNPIRIIQAATYSRLIFCVAHLHNPHIFAFFSGSWLPSNTPCETQHKKLIQKLTAICIWIQWSLQAVLNILHCWNWYPWADSNRQPKDFKSVRTTN